MKLLFLTVFLLALAALLQAQQDVTTLLFQNVKSKLSAAEKKSIATSLAFIPSGNKDQPFALDKDSKEYPFGATAYPTDLNGDGTEEIFVLFGNSYTSGNTGSSIAAFIRNAAGKYEMNLGFPGTLPDVLTTKNMGYPDLLIGGPGMEYPVFRWKGKIYDNFKSVKDADYEKLKKTSLEEVSKQYQAGLK
ncbi:MAG: hypothetical protein JNK79_11020 [Chitinophagaceae bacterium]|nr:hypothetical protein [Chitinophagaceae bacterium]